MNTVNYKEAPRFDSNQNYAPYFIVSLRDHTVQEGEPVIFEVTVSGKYFEKYISLCSIFSLYVFLALPLAEVIWDKDGEIINVDSAFRIDYYSTGRATLYIPETFLDDQGYYTCTARNALGTCRTTSRLIVTCKLNIHNCIKTKWKTKSILNG